MSFHIFIAANDFCVRITLATVSAPFGAIARFLTGQASSDFSSNKLSHRTCQGYTSNRLGYLRTADLIKIISLHSATTSSTPLKTRLPAAYYTRRAIPSSQVISLKHSQVCF